MNESIRNAVRDAMKAQKVTQEELAKRVGVNRVYVNRMLNGKTSDAPKNWTKVLEELGLELTVKERR